MSLPKISDFMGKGLKNVEYKKVSLLHSIKNCLSRNTIIPHSCSKSPHKSSFESKNKIDFN